VAIERSNKTADSEPFQELAATKYDDDGLEFETVTQFVEAETAQWVRLLNADLEDEPLDLAARQSMQFIDDCLTRIDHAQTE
jgi:hypothetical protein